MAEAEAAVVQETRVDRAGTGGVIDAGVRADGAASDASDASDAVGWLPIVHLGTGATVGWSTTASEGTPVAALVDRSLALLCRHADSSAVEGPFVSIGLSAAAMGAPDVTATVLAALERHGVPSRRVRVEVSQASLIADLPRAARDLAELRAHGVRIGMMAGSPQSSLTSLRHLPVDHLRLHRSVTASVGESGIETALASAVILVARDLRLELIADGVDDADSERSMRRLGCELGQGAHFAHPAAAARAASLRFPPPRSYPMPANEGARLALLHDAAILDTEPEAVFDDIARRAAELCGAPIAIVTLVDAERQYHQAVYGTTIAAHIEREHSVCAHAICGPDVLVVEDLHADPRFDWNLFVHGEQGFRFYAGAPLLTSDGMALGAVCVLDRRPRRLEEHQRRGLELLAAGATAHIELRARLRQLAASRSAHERAVVALAAAATAAGGRTITSGAAGTRSA